MGLGKRGTWGSQKVVIYQPTRRHSGILHLWKQPNVSPTLEQGKGGGNEKDSLAGLGGFVFGKRQSPHPSPTGPQQVPRPPVRQGPVTARGRQL